MSVNRVAIMLSVVTLAACTASKLNPATAHTPDRAATAQLAEDLPEMIITPNQEKRADSAALDLAQRMFDNDEEGQSDTLPTLPAGTSIEMLRTGDQVFHGKGGCLNCHGAEGEGLPARGKPLSRALGYLPANDWRAIDSLVHVGMDEALTRSPIAMPPRGQHSDLTSAEMDAVAAYVWAISQTKGEPWPGGHARHVMHNWRASGRTSIP
jgi:mono/diheme cytochrome c family protein